MPERCQLYLAAPAALAADFTGQLAAVLEAVPVACLRLPALADVGELVKFAQDRDVAVVIDGDAELAQRLGADGVHLADPEAYAAARRLLGDKAIVGVHCGTSRHAGMLAGDAGADYVAFEADLELIAWWAEVMIVPVVAELGDDIARAAEFAAAGADFIAVGGKLWQDAGGAIALIKHLAAEIAGGSEPKPPVAP